MGTSRDHFSSVSIFVVRLVFCSSLFWPSDRGRFQRFPSSEQKKLSDWQPLYQHSADRFSCYNSHKFQVRSFFFAQAFRIKRFKRFSKSFELRMKRCKCSAVFLGVAAAIFESRQGRKNITKKKRASGDIFSDSFTKFS